MATKIALKHKTTGIMKNGFYGYSWTTLFFGGFPALFRGDFITFIGVFAVLFILAIATAGIGTFLAMIVWSFFYNNYYTKKLIEKGYELAGSDSENLAAASALNIKVTNQYASTPRFYKDEKTLSNDAYKIYLTKKYNVEKNDVLGKFICKDRLFDTVDDALLFAHNEFESLPENSKKLSKIKPNGCIECTNCGGENYPDQFMCRFCKFKLITE